jgi:hypothetical protein
VRGDDRRLGKMRGGERKREETRGNERKGEETREDERRREGEVVIHIIHARLLRDCGVYCKLWS